MKFKDVGQMRTATLKRFLFQEHFDEHLAVQRCDDLGRGGDLTGHDWVVAKREQLRAEEGRQTLPPSLLCGDDLIEMGFAPGPLFREILEDVQTEQLEGRLLCVDEAKAHVFKRWSPVKNGRNSAG